MTRAGIVILLLAVALLGASFGFARVSWWISFAVLAAIVAACVVLQARTGMFTKGKREDRPKT